MLTKNSSAQLYFSNNISTIYLQAFHCQISQVSYDCEKFLAISFIIVQNLIHEKPLLFLNFIPKYSKEHSFYPLLNEITPNIILLPSKFASYYLINNTKM